MKDEFTEQTLTEGGVSELSEQQARKAAEAQAHELNMQLKSLIEQAAHKLKGEAKGASTFAPSQRRVLCKLATHGEMTQQRLLDELGLAPASLSEVVSKLADKGLVTREKLESDKRIMVIMLTPMGRATAEEMLESDEEITAGIFGCLDDAEKRSLETMLRRIAERR